MKNVITILIIIALSWFDISAQRACFFTTQGDSVCYDLLKNAYVVRFSQAINVDDLNARVDLFNESDSTIGIVEKITNHLIFYYGNSRDFGIFSQYFDNYDYNFSNVLLTKDSCVCWTSNRIIVLLKPGKNVHEILDQCEVPYDSVRRLGFDSNMYLIKTIGVEDKSLSYANRLFKSGNVVFAQPDLGMLVQAANNTYYSDQWGLNNTGQYNGQLGVDIKVENAWGFSSGSGIRVAVIDEGVDLTHPDIPESQIPKKSVSSPTIKITKQ